MPTLHAIARLVLSFVATATEADEHERAATVAHRAHQRCPDMDSAHCRGIVDACNAADLSACAVRARLSGDIVYALRCEDGRDRILARWGF